MKIIIQNIRDFLLRKKNKGKQLLFFEKIGDRNTSREEMLNNLIKVLEKNGFKIKNKKKLWWKNLKKYLKVKYHIKKWRITKIRGKHKT